MDDNQKPDDEISPPVAFPLSYWEMEHRRIMQYSNWLCKTFGFSRSGFVQGENIPVKDLRKLVFVDKST
jgi:hypothetical protein